MGMVHCEATPHRCNQPGVTHECHVGSIWKCDICGTYWVAAPGDWGYGWRRVRWHHLRARRIIKGATP